MNYEQLIGSYYANPYKEPFIVLPSFWIVQILVPNGIE